MRFLLACGLLVMATLCFANDGSVTGVGGSMHFSGGKHSSIRMAREWVNMDVFPHAYAVKVQFIFTNDGPATMVKMGFPERGVGADVDPAYYRTHTAYTHFATSVDGRAVAVKRVAVAPKSGGWNEEYQAFWVKRVHFARGQTHIVRVSYQARPGDVSDGERNVDYDFTGGTWKGAVQKSELLVTFHLPGTTFYAPRLPDSKKLCSQVINKNRLHYCWMNWQAEGECSIAYCTTDPRWLALLDAKESASSVTPPLKTTTQFTLPGTPRYSWIPPVMLRGDTVFISLHQFVIYLMKKASTRGHEREITGDWHGNAKNGATLGIGSTTLRFVAGEKTLYVNAHDRIALPAAPFFLSEDARVRGAQKYLYVPLRATLQALHGSAEIYPAERSATLTVEPFMDKGGKPGTVH